MAVINEQMDAAAELGRNPVSTIFSLSMEMSRLTRDGTAEPVSRDQILRHERGLGNIHFSCTADHVQDWQPYPRLIHTHMCNHTYIHYRILLLLYWIVLSSLKYVPQPNQNKILPFTRLTPIKLMYVLYYERYHSYLLLMLSQM